jgi:hypothetical protein
VHLCQPLPVGLQLGQGHTQLTLQQHHTHTRMHTHTCKQSVCVESP